MKTQILSWVTKYQKSPIIQNTLTKANTIDFGSNETANSQETKSNSCGAKRIESQREREYLVDAANSCGAKRWWLSRVAGNLRIGGATVIGSYFLFTNPFCFCVLYLRIPTGSCRIAYQPIILIYILFF